MDDDDKEDWVELVLDHLPFSAVREVMLEVLRDLGDEVLSDLAEGN
jgi:hypothetical protein